MSSRLNHPKTPTGESVPLALYDPQLRWPMRRARWVYAAREAFNTQFIYPLEDHLLQRWLGQGRLSEQVEALGLPRRSVETHLGNRLELNIEPRELVRLISLPKSFPERSERRTVTSLFLWKGDWDLTHFDFRTLHRYRFISNIWRHRNDLSRSDAYRELLQQLEQGKPFRSHHKGILLNTPEKILTYLQLYIGYMEDMERSGFDKELGKDSLGVAIDRNGMILKLNRGLHRLAMAQVLGLDEITVRVRAVHGLWWQQVTQGEAGERALERMVQALPACRPAG